MLVALQPDIDKQLQACPHQESLAVWERLNKLERAVVVKIAGRRALVQPNIVPSIRQESTKLRRKFFLTH